MLNSDMLRATSLPLRNGRWPVLEKLKKWLENNGLSQSEAAARAGLCIPVFNRILNGRKAASKAAGFAIERLTGKFILADDLFRVIPAPPTSTRRRQARRRVVRGQSVPSDGRAARNLGPFRSEAAALSFLTGRLVTALRPEAVLLFGSRAGGRARHDSDFDLLVVLPDAAASPPDHFVAYAPIAGSGLGVDVVPCRLADYLAERDQPGTVAFAAHQGRTLYVRPGNQLRAGDSRRHRRQ